MEFKLEIEKHLSYNCFLHYRTNFAERFLIVRAKSYTIFVDELGIDSSDPTYFSLKPHSNFGTGGRIEVHFWLKSWFFRKS